MKLSDFIRGKVLTMLSVAMAAVATASLSSCGMIYEDEGDCTPYCYVRFVYDRNMEFADAFASKVNAVDLYVFDENGKFVMQTSEHGDALKADGYRMPLNVQPWRYTVVAWCGLGGDNDTYDVPDMTPGQSTLQDLKCRLADRERHDTEVSVGEIDRLYHGITTFTLPDEYGDHVYTVSLTKNTNDVRIVLQNTSGEALNADDFTFAVTDENGYLDYDNSVLDDELLTYRPWYVSQGTAGVDTGGAEGITSVSAVVAELTVSRLVKDKHNGTNTMLTVRKAKPEADGTHKTVLSIPLIDYALLVKGNYNRDMDDQEYLDRQDEYNMVFFLDNDGNWLSSSIIINSWRVVLSDVDLGE